jgi:hypothetical protein
MAKFKFIKNALGEALDKASRMKRAKDMGFDTDKVWYHGTRGDIDEFKINPEGPNLYGKGVYLTDSPEEAALYANSKRKGLDLEEDVAGPNILPLHVRSEKPFDLTKDYTPDSPELKGLKDILNDPDKWDMDGSKLGDDLYKTIARRFGKDKVIEALQQLGYDAMLIPRKSMKDDTTFRNLVMFDPEKVRSVNAAFDPKYKGSPNISAGLAAAALGSDLLSSEEDTGGKFKKTKRSVNKKD